jgi:hypothetical protein
MPNHKLPPNSIAAETKLDIGQKGVATTSLEDPFHEFPSRRGMSSR